jgi:hypothetical protein
MKTQKGLITIFLVSILSSIALNSYAKLAKFKPLEEITLQLGSFSKIELDGGYEVLLMQGNEESVSIETESDKLGYVKTSVKDGKLNVYNDKSIQNYKVRLIIRFKNIDEIKFNGGVSLKCKKEIVLTKLLLKVAGGADIKIQLKAQELKCELDGGINCDLTGNATDLSINLNGAGKIDAEKFLAENAKVEIAGAGYVIVNGSKSIDARISGIGSIEYTGSPLKVKSVVNGVGSIREK